MFNGIKIMIDSVENVTLNYLGTCSKDFYELDIDYLKADREEIKKLFDFFKRNAELIKPFGKYNHTIWEFKDCVIKLAHK